MTATKELLNCDAITVEPRSFSYEADTHEEFNSGGTWSHYPPYRQITTVKEAHDAYDALGLDWDDFAKNYDQADELEADALLEEARAKLEENDHEAGWPQMNYFYELPGMDDDEAAALSLRLHLYGPCLCVVKVDDENGLALTGGGMDLSWEICEAYIMAGYLPPVHFAGRLPRMAGRGTSKKDRRILARCRESLQTVIGWNRSHLRQLRESFPA